MTNKLLKKTKGEEGGMDRKRHTDRKTMYERWKNTKKR
jgi:hypothetical protein